MSEPVFVIDNSEHPVYHTREECTYVARATEPRETTTADVAEADVEYRLCWVCEYNEQTDSTDDGPTTLHGRLAAASPEDLGLTATPARRAQR